VLDLACGHGRITRELARRGADVTGVDVSAALLARARAREDEQPLGIRYVHADVASVADALDGDVFDAVTCNFGLSDIDDLDGCLRTVTRSLRPGGRFVFAILHPCFAGGGDVSGSWPSTGRYADEGWWSADGERSTLRRQVGANHRRLSTYMNALVRSGLAIDALSEPAPAEAWASARPDVARLPVFLVGRCVRSTG
jgi:SAM-dependent methyltransferase